ncbi:ROK family protein [Agrococcus sp. ARC_14]|uniref:ROK family protein n=1 Tax=Agrococcus sp. ARC_14 TaxID=2919927 RepID=UPI001F05ECEB|nr:ROK family protein [Agrococcus sp. ARC_14]MCH1881856.1 ROK family protein [Agrococcus sp. ARC_14]
MTVAGIDIGGSKIAAVALAARARGSLDRTPADVLVRTYRAHSIRSLEALIDAVEACVRELDDRLAAAGHPPIAAVGLSLAAWMTRDRALVLWAAHLLVRDAPVKALLEQRLDLPIVLENDANGYLVGEAAMGAAADASSSILVALGTGVGGAHVVDGRPFIGANGMGAELGHVTIDESGPRCSCDAHGCLESFAGGNALRREAAHVPAAVTLAPDGVPTAEHLAAAARAGDAQAIAVMEGAAKAVAAGLRRMLPAFDPEVVVLGGTVMLTCADLLLPVIERELAQHAPLQGVPQPRRLVLAQLGGHAAAIGAAVLAS